LVQIANVSESVGAHLLDGTTIDLDGVRIAGVGGIVGNVAKPGRRDEETFLSMIERVLESAPDVLVLYEGPEDAVSKVKPTPRRRVPAPSQNLAKPIPPMSVEGLCCCWPRLRKPSA